MRITVVNSLYHPYRVGGAEVSVQLLVEALIADGHELTVIATEPGRDLRVEDVNGARVYYVGLRNIYWPFVNAGHPDLPGSFEWAKKTVWHSLDSYNPFMGQRILQILSMREPDVVHTNNLAGISVAAWEACHKAGTPIVHTMRDYYALCPSSTMFRNGKNCDDICPRCQVFGSPRRHASRLVDAAVGVSRYVLDFHVRAGYFPNAVERTAIFNPVRIAPPSPPPDPDSPLTFASLGRIEPQKGTETLLEAFSGIPAGVARLVVAGTGERSYVEQLQRRYRRPDIEFPGFVDAETVYSRAHCVVVPAVWQEPLSRTVLEAFAHGLPAVSMRVGGMAELITHEHTGLLVTPGDTDELRASMLRIIDNRDLLATMARNAAARVTDLTPDRHAAAYLSVYEQAIAARTGALLPPLTTAR